MRKVSVWDDFRWIQRDFCSHLYPWRRLGSNTFNQRWKNNLNCWKTQNLPSTTKLNQWGLHQSDGLWEKNRVTLFKGTSSPISRFSVGQRSIASCPHCHPGLWILFIWWRRSSEIANERVVGRDHAELWTCKIFWNWLKAQTYQSHTSLATHLLFTTQRALIRTVTLCC